MRCGLHRLELLKLVVFPLLETDTHQSTVSVCELLTSIVQDFLQHHTAVNGSLID